MTNSTFIAFDAPFKKSYKGKTPDIFAVHKFRSRLALRLTGMTNKKGMMKANLEKFAEFLQIWAPKLNLVGLSTLDHVWERHIEDSLQILPLISSEVKQILDIGSGAGFPGVVIGIMTSVPLTIIEKDQKKVAFLTHVKAHLGLDHVKIIEKRWEDWDNHDQFYDLFVCRALAKLSDLMPMAQKFLKPSGYALFMKGKNWKTEHQEAQKTWIYECTTQESQTNDQSAILGVRNIRSR